MKRFWVIHTPSSVTGVEGKITSKEDALDRAIERAEKTGNQEYVMEVVGVARPNKATWQPLTDDEDEDLN